jgi:hypothetical protein
MTTQVQRLLNELLSSGKVPPELMNQVRAAMADPAQLDRVLAQLKAMGADPTGSAPLLEISDYYKAGPGKYELRWELPRWMPLPMAFGELDRKTQFFVLFQEWSRREMEGMAALTGGDVDGAERIFNECVERAEQIEVNDLLARTYEDLRRVAQRRGDLVAEREWNKRAADVRKR